MLLWGSGAGTPKIYDDAAAAEKSRQEDGGFSLMSEVAINPLKCKLAPSRPEMHAAGLGEGRIPNPRELWIQT